MRPTGFWTRCHTALLTSCLLGLPLAALSLETQAAEPDFITLVIENEGDYPITFEPPFNVDSSDFERKYPVDVPKYATAKGLESGPVVIGARQQGMLVMALSKPMFNILDIFSKDWGFNLKFCQERGACDEARLNGTIRSTTSFNWKQSNNFSQAQVSNMTNDELEAYAKTKAVISGILTTLGSVLGLPFGAGGMIGGLPDAQNFKVTLKQQCNARFSINLEPSLAANGDFLVDLRVNRVLPSDMSNFNGFVIDDNAVLSQGLRLVENACRDGRQAQCLIRLNGGTDMKNLNTTEFSVTDRAGCKAVTSWPIPRARSCSATRSVSRCATPCSSRTAWSTTAKSGRTRTRTCASWWARSWPPSATRNVRRPRIPGWAVGAWVSARCAWKSRAMVAPGSRAACAAACPCARAPWAIRMPTT